MCGGTRRPSRARANVEHRTSNVERRLGGPRSVAADTQFQIANCQLKICNLQFPHPTVLLYLRVLCGKPGGPRSVVAEAPSPRRTQRAQRKEVGFPPRITRIARMARKTDTDRRLAIGNRRNYSFWASGCEKTRAPGEGFSESPPSGALGSCWGRSRFPVLTHGATAEPRPTGA